MLKAEILEVAGFKPAIKGMRNPMNSWGKSDSVFCNGGTCPQCEDYENCNCDEDEDFSIGQNDLDLMKRLFKAGTEHRKYLRMINVYLDITAPLYWWKEFETYKVGTVTNSCSTMHKIHAKEFTLDDFSCEHLMSDKDSGSELVTVEGENTDILVTPKSLLTITIDCLNNYRKMFVDTNDKPWFWQMIQLLPSSYNQTRTVMLNYEVCAKIVKERTGHKLDEWAQLIDVINTLPYFKEITND